MLAWSLCICRASVWKILSCRKASARAASPAARAADSWVSAALAWLDRRSIRAVAAAAPAFVAISLARSFSAAATWAASSVGERVGSCPAPGGGASSGDGVVLGDPVALGTGVVLGDPDGLGTADVVGDGWGVPALWADAGPAEITPARSTVPSSAPPRAARHTDRMTGPFTSPTSRILASLGRHLGASLAGRQ